MLYRLLADTVLLLHLAFILFTVLGALLVRRWPRLIWLHLPAAAWGATIELSGGLCPLTVLENQLRRASGEAGYPDGFIEHYLLPVIYPDDLTRQAQALLGLGVVVINLGAYAWLYLVARKARKKRPPKSSF